MDIKDMLNKVHCADCLDFMRLIPDKSIDLVLTDGLDFNYNRVIIKSI